MEPFLSKHAHAVIGTLSGFDRLVFRGTLRFPRASVTQKWLILNHANLRAKVEASIGRYKRVIGDALRSRTSQIEATEVAIASAALNRMLEFGRSNYVRIA